MTTYLKVELGIIIGYKLKPVNPFSRLIVITEAYCYRCKACLLVWTPERVIRFTVTTITSTAKAATRNYGSGIYEIFFRLNFVAVKNVANMSNGSIAQNGNSGIIGSYSP